jgi:hypothetical protein
VALRGELLTIVNSGEAMTDLRVALIDRGGERYVARAAEGLAPGEELVVAFEAFSPVPAADTRFQSVEINGTGRSGARSATLALR